MRQTTAVAIALGLLLGGGTAHAEWFKGNTHCHTSASPDSSTPIEALMGWYKSEGYDFVVVTDHNKYTTEEALNALRDEGGRLLADDTFTLIPGEELTTSAHHINGIDLPSRLDPANTISAAFELVWAQGALPQLNHPEWNYLEARDIIEELSEMDGPMFLEIYNSHPSVIDRSGPSSEDVWDSVLTAGRFMWGVAVDDAHTLVGGDKPPGGGFIVVDAASRNKADILDAMTRGRFYASSGASLADFTITDRQYDVDAPGATRIVFIGERGQVLEQVQGDFGSYRFRYDEGYVRARVESPDGFAWTQPALVGGAPPNEAPTAVITATATSGEAPLTVQLDGSASSDPDGQIESWRWDFGDGATGRGEAILHTFDAPGVYTVELTVFDDKVDPGRDTLQITVVRPGEPIPEPEPTPEPDPSPVAEPTPTPDPPSANIQQGKDEGCQTAPGAPSGLWLMLLLIVGLRRRI